MLFDRRQEVVKNLESQVHHMLFQSTLDSTTMYSQYAIGGPLQVDALTVAQVALLPALPVAKSQVLSDAQLVVWPDAWQKVQALCQRLG